MKSAIWLVVGTALGFVVAHTINATPQGRAFFDDVRATASRFTSAVVDGYRSREAELRDGPSADGR
ncbi:MAG: hypothetical protein RI885_1005 [Actinomycetota bacterium]|jgi:hypothetical protein